MFLQAIDELIIDCIEVLDKISASCKLWEGNVPDQIMAAVCKDLPFI